MAKFFKKTLIENPVFYRLSWELDKMLAGLPITCVRIVFFK